MNGVPVLLEQGQRRIVYVLRRSCGGEGAVPLLMLLLLVGVLAFMWVARRHSTLTRACLWRQERSAGLGAWRCAACGARVDLPAAARPKDCLRRKDR